jgi:hypothetical protein
MAFWGRRKREEQERQDAADQVLAVKAQKALVATDERIRTTRDELAFAPATTRRRICATASTPSAGTCARLSSCTS